MAEQLGYASPSKMLGEMTPDEYSHWRAYYRIYPMPQRRADMHAGSILNGVTMGPLKNPPGIEDCTLDFEPPREVTRQEKKQFSDLVKKSFSNLPIVYMPRPKNGSNKDNSS